MNGHIVIGTAGHVDHGKTLLTAALTGINTDRLPEEKRRGMTIVPGFVPLELPNGMKLGLIDVPGHEKFIKNMLAGVGGIDMALLVVAADEGVMPQTVEHLNILHLLGIQKGIVAITKCDMIDDDPEWLEMIHGQVHALLSKTLLRDAPIIDISAVTGYNIPQLRDLLGEVASEARERPPVGFSRMPIDRCFTKQGFGTVVTGTIWAGAVYIGQKLELHPQNVELRVRRIQVHGQSVERALAGQRTAINLTGVGVENAAPGCWLTEPGLLRSSYRLDVKLDLLQNAEELKHCARVHLFHGTSEVSGRVRMLDREILKAGESCLCQLELEKPLPPLRGDRLILRAWSPEITIAGATVLDTEPPRYKLSDPDTMEIIERKNGRDNAQTVLDMLEKEAKPLNIKNISTLVQLTEEDTESALQSLLDDRRAILLEDDRKQYLSAERYERWRETLKDVLEQFHQQYPLRGGFPTGELRQRVFGHIHTKQLAMVLAGYERDGTIRNENAVIASATFKRNLTNLQQQHIDRIVVAYKNKLFNPPDWEELMVSFKIPQNDAQEYFLYLLDQGTLVRIGKEYFYQLSMQTAEQMLRGQYTRFTVAQARDTLGTTRKFVLPLLERMDAKNITVRDGDERYFRN